MTFSIVARCSRTGMFGVAVSSSSPAVAARCAFAGTGIGAVASQNITDPRLGPQALELMSRGANAQECIEILSRVSQQMSFRQLLLVDRSGGSEIFTGANVLGLWSEAKARDAACAGNLLANESVPHAMLEAFHRHEGDHLADRLLAALDAALVAGGEAGPVRSAGLKLVADVDWPVADLRCDWSEQCPVNELKKLWTIYGPQMDAYVTRALQPSKAPSYGVPGDE